MFNTRSQSRRGRIFSAPPFRYNTEFKGDIGIEMEMEGFNLPSRVVNKKRSLGVRWNIVGDGSLRAPGGLQAREGNNTPYEYVLSEPCTLETLGPIVNQLFDTFDANDTEIIHSNRTSTHVHINVSELRVNEITSFIILWNIFEDALVNWCGDDRIGNLFCLRTRDCPTALESFEDGLKADLSFRIPEGSKYLACNYHAMQRYGSLEFRCMAGATNAKSVIDWATFLLAMREYAVEHYKNPEIIGMALSEDSPSRMLERICEMASLPHLYDEILSAVGNEDIDDMCKRGYRRVQSLSYALPWYDLQEDIYKVSIPNPFERIYDNAPPPRYENVPQEDLDDDDDEDIDYER
jgi:hypothetical protein